jgi:hypothetical protein
MKMPGKKAQVAIYVIIALALVGGIVVFFAFRENIFGPTVNPELKPALDYYQSCMEEQAKQAIDLAGSQGGHIYNEQYVPGSEYAPFSSELNFLGFPVPYWFYISGNGLVKENVPMQSDIEGEISRYIEERLNANCNFGDFNDKGFVVTLGEPKVKTTISDTKVSFAVTSDITVSKDDNSATKNSYSIDINSKFGKLFSTARAIYDKQRTDAVFDNYTADILRSYAPVDGVEISCSGKIWKTQDVINTLKDALVANVGALKFKGDYYTIKNKENNYFVIDLPVDEPVNLIYSRDWPTKVEIYGADDQLMVAEPVGTQEGMGVMGFCYAPYHFVYDISYPILIQVSDGTELFQFPVVVVVDKNMPRQAMLPNLPSEEETPEVDICQFNTQDMQVNVYDTQLNAIDANLTYICFNQQCNLGSTTNGKFIGKAPACLNGYLRARAEGYSEKKQLLSTNEQSSADVILDREYDVKLDLEVGGKPLEGTAIVVFQGTTTSSTALPDESTIKLSEGLYNITVYVYANSSVTIPESTKTQCTEVSKGGVMAFFGGTEQKCFDISIPETKLDSSLAGGGKSEVYILPSDLEKGTLYLKVDLMPTPKSLDDLQNNFEAFDGMGVELTLA